MREFEGKWYKAISFFSSNIHSWPNIWMSMVLGIGENKWIHFIPGSLHTYSIHSETEEILYHNKGTLADLFGYSLTVFQRWVNLNYSTTYSIVAVNSKQSTVKIYIFDIFSDKIVWVHTTIKLFITVTEK